MQPLQPDMFAPECPSSVTPFRIGDKWGGMVVLCLEGGPRRFSELRVPLRTVSPKVLTETLRSLERDGMITRRAYDEIPPRVEYAITELGRTLLAPIEACREWAARHLPELMAARDAFDRSASAEHAEHDDRDQGDRGREHGDPRALGGVEGGGVVHELSLRSEAGTSAGTAR
ncbi:winged helix-turn-helix transcriptional regulator [Amycolatopsis sp. NPDC059027]|uniref:winged helix-turn-helix transcriptional regulator n=1 Tax=Amycolatopsis sp. NPDC059027 TaxID=3346709 RepID=UPI00366C1824